MLASDREAFEAAKKKKFLMLPPRAEKLDVRNAWWRYCTRQRMPYLIVRPGAKYASLNLDLLPADKEFTDVFNDPVWKPLLGSHAARNGAELHLWNEGLDFAGIRSDTCEALAHAILYHVSQEGVTRPQPTSREIAEMMATGQAV
jgi:hypothetical protein